MRLCFLKPTMKRVATLSLISVRHILAEKGEGEERERRGRVEMIVKVKLTRVQSLSKKGMMNEGFGDGVA